MDPGYRSGWGGAAGPGLAALLPEGMACVEALGEVAPEPLFPDELDFIAKAVDSRRDEFARGRTCARRALALLGREAATIPSRDREPIWPEGAVGAITHCRGYCAAAVTTRDRWSGVGIDAEILQVLEPGLANRIMVAAEARHLEELPPSHPWACVLFSAKEAIFKAWYPDTRRWLSFRDAELRLFPAEGRFQARLTIDAPRFAGRPLPALEGRFIIDGPRVLCAVVL